MWKCFLKFFSLMEIYSSYKSEFYGTIKDLIEIHCLKNISLGQTVTYTYLESSTKILRLKLSIVSLLGASK